MRFSTETEMGYRGMYPYFRKPTCVNGFTIKITTIYPGEMKRKMGLKLILRYRYICVNIGYCNREEPNSVFLDKSGTHVKIKLVWGFKNKDSGVKISAAISWVIIYI